MANRRIKKRVSPIDLDQKFYDKDLSFLKTFLTVTALSLLIIYPLYIVILKRNLGYCL